MRDAVCNQGSPHLIMRDNAPFSPSGKSDIYHNLAEGGDFPQWYELTSFCDFYEFYKYRPPIRRHSESDAGIRQVKTLPAPGTLAAVNAPPCATASCRAIVSPNPDPPVARARDGSVR